MAKIISSEQNKKTVKSSENNPSVKKVQTTPKQLAPKTSSAKSKSELFNQIASGIQSIALTIGLLIGGWWALKTFVFQNPGFYENGQIVAGYDTNTIGGTLEIISINKEEKMFEIEAKITNNSPNFAQSISLVNIPLLATKVKTSDKNIYSLEVSNQIFALSKEINLKQESEENTGRLSYILIPKVQTASIHYLFKATESGVYLFELNPCKLGGGSCVIQRYLFIE